MRTTIRTFGTLILLVGLMLGFAASVSASHNGNNKTNVTGTSNAEIHGQATLNYSKGTGTFNGRITVSHLTPGETYTFSVVAPGPMTVICSGEANNGGTFTCSAQGLELPGFTTLVVVDSGGTTVADGTFERRGNCRDPQQGGSQCDAPGQND